MSDESNRRLPVAHPGPELDRDYLVPLGLSVEAVARHIGVTDAPALAAMLVGSRSIDVETAIRLARAFQLSPVELMERQNRFDFRTARVDETLERIPPIGVGAAFAFPEDRALRGSLVGLERPDPYAAARIETLGFIADSRTLDDDIRARTYGLEPGSILRVFERDGTVAWCGPVLHTFDGQPIFAAVRLAQWLPWFTENHRAAYVPPERRQRGAMTSAAPSRSIA